MSRPEQIAINGFLVWAHVVELEGALRLRVSVDEWDQLGLYRGQQVSLEREGSPAESILIAEAIEKPPVVWAVMVNRLRSAS